VLTRLSAPSEFKERREQDPRKHQKEQLVKVSKDLAHMDIQGTYTGGQGKLMPHDTEELGGESS